MHPEDDVARNIRNQQMADAAPTAEEAKAMHREHLASEGCSKCDEDDPDRLDTYYKPFPSCPRYQAPRDPTVILCDDHKDSIESIRERAINRAREKNDREQLHGKDEPEIVAIALYECKMSENIRKVEPPTNDRGEPRQPYPGETIPETLIECKFCNSCLDEVIRLKDVRAEERLDHVREILAESRTVDMSLGMIRHALLDRGDPDADQRKPVKKALSELHSEGEIEITRRKGWYRRRYALVSDEDENGGEE